MKGLIFIKSPNNRYLTIRQGTKEVATIKLNDLKKFLDDQSKDKTEIEPV